MSQKNQQFESELDQDLEVVEAYFDGELSVRDAEQLERRIETEVRLQNHLDSLRLARQEFREFFLDESRLDSRRVDVWDSIAGRLERKTSWVGKLQEFLTAPGPSRGAFAAMAAALIATLSFQVGTMFGPSSTPVAGTDLSQLARSSERDVREFPVGQFGNSGVGSEMLENVGYFTGSGGSQLAPAAGSEVYVGPQGFGRTGFERTLEKSGQEEGNSRKMALQFSLTAKGPDGEVRHFRGLVPVPNGAFPLMENRKDFMRSGMRTPGADIEWVRSDKTFKILPSASLNQPPVIWVAGEERGSKPGR